MFAIILFLLSVPPDYRIPRSKSHDLVSEITIQISYTFSLIYGISLQVSSSLLLIYLGYFISLIILILFNKVMRFQTSGHACSVFGPLVLLVYFIGPAGIIACTTIFLAVVWSSLYLGRHTAKDLALGAASSLMAMAISIAIFGSLC